MSVSASAKGVLADRRGLWAFWFGCLAVTTGVLLHLPMFWMARDMGFRLAGMPMGPGMLAGMGLIVGGIALSGWGLLPRRDPEAAARAAAVHVTPPEDAPLTWAHGRLMLILVVALVIDVMKPASLGFVVPGMRARRRGHRHAPGLAGDRRCRAAHCRGGSRCSPRHTG